MQALSQSGGLKVKAILPGADGGRAARWTFGWARAQFLHECAAFGCTGLRDMEAANLAEGPA
jgi:hypothetical protein